MSTTEERLQRLKVVELKEILAKNSLVQTGKKEDLIKRLLDNEVSLDDAPAGGEEELTEPPVTGTEGSTGEAYSAAPAPPPTTAEASEASAIPTSAEAPILTAEQQAMKARAERFGVPFNPNPTPTAKKAPTTATPAAVPESKKGGPIDKASLGIPDETLAKRAARFGLPDIKAGAQAVVEAVKETVAPASAGKPKSAAEITPEQAAKNAEDEEKKRKRAEKFGSAAPASTKSDSADTEPDAKKVKV